MTRKVTQFDCIICNKPVIVINNACKTVCNSCLNDENKLDEFSHLNGTHNLSDFDELPNFEQERRKSKILQWMKYEYKKIGTGWCGCTGSDTDPVTLFDVIGYSPNYFIEDKYDQMKNSGFWD